MSAVYVCSECSHESPSYLLECPACGRGFFSLNEARPAAAYAAPAAPPVAEGELRVCYKCDHETREKVERCPRCGNRRVVTRTAVRVLGGVLVGVGLFLVLFMGAITLFVIGIVAQTGRPGSTQSFTGGTKELALIFGIFGLVIAFGATSVLAGALQMVRGRRSKTMVRLILGIFVALVLVAELVYILL